MPTLTTLPQLLKGGLVLIDPVSAAVQQIIAFQYNPETLTRTLQVQGAGPESGDRLEALRLKGPPVETIKLDAELDITDPAPPLGLHPQLAALEMIIYPASEQLLANNVLAQMGTLEIASMIAPLTLFIWSKVRILPVRITELSITEEAFDTNLNPTRAKVSLGMRVLNVNDLGFDVKGGDLYMTYQKGKELLAQGPTGSFAALGIGGIP
jgi:hypothetical protein